MTSKNRYPSRSERDTRPVAVVAIGAAGCGPDQLHRLVASLPQEQAPAYVVMPGRYGLHPATVAAVLTPATAMPVVVVRDGDVPVPGTVAIVPPGASACWECGCLRWRPERAQGRLLDGLLDSLAFGLGARALAVVLGLEPGDGREGLPRLAAVGGTCLLADAVHLEVDVEHWRLPADSIGAAIAQLLYSPAAVYPELDEQCLPHPQCDLSLQLLLERLRLRQRVTPGRRR